MRAESLRGVGIALVVAACSARASGAQVPDVIVQRVGPLRLTADPGSRLTLAFRVTSRDRRERVVETAVRLPTGWRSVIPDSAVTVAAGASELALIPIAIPADARAGAYAVRYAAVTPSATQQRGTGQLQDSVIVRVAERRQMAATLTSAPRFVAAGESYKLAFVIRNIGNARAVARVQLTGVADVTARIDSAVVSLDPGEERSVNAFVATNAREARKIVQHVGIVALPPGDTTTYASAASVVEVIPRRIRAVSTRHALPVQLGLGKSGPEGRLTPELRGSGFLTGDRSSQLDFVFRPPSPGSFLTAQDEYWLTVARTDKYRFQFGDQSYGSTRLLQPFRPGAGASAEMTIGRLVLGAQGQRDRRTYTLTGESQYAGTIDVRLLSNRARLGGAYLSRSGVNSGTIWMGRGLFQLPASNTLQWEYGRGNSRIGQGDAYIGVLSGGAGPVTYGLQREASDLAFPGLGAGITHSAATVRFRATRHFALFGSAVDDVRHSTFAGSANVLHRELESGVDLLRFLGVAYRQTRDTGLVFSPAKRGTSVRAFVTLPLRRLMLGARVEGGYSVHDGAPTVRIPFRRAGGNANVSIAGQSLGASIERLSGTPIYGFTEVDQTSGQITAGIRLTKDTRLNVSFATTRSPAAFGGVYSMLDIGLDQLLPMGHRAQWRGQSMSYGPGAFNQQSRQHAQYLIPFGLPVPGADESGAVDVRVLEGSARRPVVGALVRFGGDARITDATGRARFSGFAPGSYYLELDRSYLGAGRIVTPAMPMSIELVRGERRAVELRLTGAAKVEGAIQLLEFAEHRPLGAPDTLVAAGGQANLRLQLTNNGDTLRALSNGGGRFRFADVHPGHWVLTVLPIGMPALHYAELERIEFDLAPGEAREVSIRLLPVRPAVQFIEDVEIKVTAERPEMPERPRLRARWPVADSRWRAPEVKHWYTVTKHDVSLFYIARFMYNDASLWPKIWVANLDQLVSPDRMRPGQRLRVPEPGPLTAAEIAARDAYFARKRKP